MKQKDYSEEALERAGFEDLGDKERRILLDAAVMMANAIARNAPPYSLTLCGTSGTGKSHLAHFLFNWAKVHLPGKDNGAGRGVMLPAAVAYKKTEEACSRFLDGDYRYGEWLVKQDFLVLDDLGTERDPKLYWRNKLQQVVDARLGKWTVYTSNLFYRQLAEYDVRLASRLIRQGGQLVESKATDYSIEKLKNPNK